MSASALTSYIIQYARIQQFLSQIQLAHIIQQLTAIGTLYKFVYQYNISQIIKNQKIKYQQLAQIQMQNQSTNSYTLSSTQLLGWIKQNFTFPNVSHLTNINQLKSGVIIASILSQILAQKYHNMFMSKIQINNINPQTCINNLKVIKSVVSMYISMQMNGRIGVSKYSAQGIYYRQQDMVRFMSNVIVRVWEHSRVDRVDRSNNNRYKIDDNYIQLDQVVTYPSTIAAHLRQSGSAYNISQFIAINSDSKSRSRSKRDTINNSISNNNNNNNNNDSINTNTNINSKQLGNNNKYQNINVSQLSDIINTSNIIENILDFKNHQQPQPQPYNNTNTKTKTKTKTKYNQFIINNTNKNKNNNNQQLQKQYYQYQLQQHNDSLQEQQQQLHIQPAKYTITTQQKQSLTQWIYNKLSIPYTQPQTQPQIQTQPEQILGRLINSIFCAGRLTNPVIKDAHFKHGPIFVYRKIVDFVLMHPLADRVNKTSALTIMKSIEKEGVLRETDYWMLVRDIYLYEATKGRPNRAHSLSRDSYTRGGSITKQQRQDSKTKTKPNNNNKYTNKQQNKQNTCLNKKPSTKTLQKCKTSKVSIAQQAPQIKYNIVHVKQCQQWITKQLGYQHSLSKSKNYTSSSNIYDNPLLNGTLVGSILMRLKIGKPMINKFPTNAQQLRNNWDQINRICSLRGYQSLKKLPISTHISNTNIPNTNIHDIINLYLSYLKQLKQQHTRKYPQSKNSNNTSKYQQTSTTRRPNNCNECTWQLKTKPNLSQKQQLHQHKQDIKQWLFKQFAISVHSEYLSVSHLTQICRELLNINIYRQTTDKIKMNNVEKILGQLRRIGLGDYYHVRKQDVMVSEDELRWKIVSDLKWVIDGKIQFCQA